MLGRHGERARRVQAALLACCSACSSSPLDEGGAGEGLAFTPCAIDSTSEDGEAECVTVSRPIFADDPDGAQIDVFFRRLRATATRRGQLWLLPGGPGQTADDYSSYLTLFSRALPDFDVYVADHRGAGHSTPLDCAAFSDPGAADPIGDCGRELEASWGDALAGFRTTEAAHDVAFMIESTRSRSDRVIVHGASYGGYWLHRLIQVAPDDVDAAIFESSLSAVSTDGTLRTAAAPDEAGHALMTLCEKDEICRDHLGDDAYARARSRSWPTSTAAAPTPILRAGCSPRSSRWRSRTSSSA